MPETIEVKLPGFVLQSQRNVPVATIATPPLVIRALSRTPTLYVEPSYGSTLTFSEVTVADPHITATVNIELYDDTWASTMGTAAASTTSLLRALRSQQQEQFGWNAVLLPALSHGDVSRVNDTRLAITLPEVSNYSIRAPETITLMVPASATTLKRTVQAPSIVVTASAGVLRVTGALRFGCTDEMLRAAEAVDAVLALDGDYFKPAIGMDDALTNSFLAGLQSSLVSASGWESAVRPLLSRHSLQRINDSAVRLRVPQALAYRLNDTETVMINWNASDATFLPVTTSEQVYYSELAVVQPAPLHTATLTGTLLDSFSLATMRQNPAALQELPVLNVTLTGGATFNVPWDNYTEVAVVLALRAAQNEPNGFNAVVQPSITVLE
eukprot:350514-Prymnesium_polylepis.1